MKRHHRLIIETPPCQEVLQLLLHCTLRLTGPARLLSCLVNVLLPAMRLATCDLGRSEQLAASRAASRLRPPRARSEINVHSPLVEHRQRFTCLIA